MPSISSVRKLCRIDGGQAIEFATTTFLLENKIKRNERDIEMYRFACPIEGESHHRILAGRMPEQSIDLSVSWIEEQVQPPK